MPVSVMLMGVSFNLMNGFLIGYWFGYLSPQYSLNWLSDPRFITGTILFVVGFITNICSDQRLINLRKGGRTGYYIPYGGLFRYISCPNFFGEILEWTGYALLTWCLPALSFLLWTIFNLVPRALDHHRWYIKTFPDYPAGRKAILPFIL
jgi:protein-S-isoprenylcysteine O-methyltransferase Ste14